MKQTKGFKKKYFSLSAILACSAAVTLQAQNMSLESADELTQSNLKSEKESETKVEVQADTIHTIEVKKRYEHTSAKTITPLSHTTDNIALITSDEIKLKGFQSLPDALGYTSGISQSANGGAGQSAALYLRGLNAAQTLFLLDGVRLNDVSGLVGAQSELIDLYDIERVEIVKGAQSGIFGADAMAGVVNIITKPTRRGFHGGFSSQIGSDKWRKLGGKLSYGDEIFDLSLALSYLQTDGISAAAPKKNESGYGDRDDGFERDGFRDLTLHLKGGANLGANDRLEFAIRKMKAKSHFDAGAGVDANDYDDLYGFGTDKYFNTIRTSLYSLGYILKRGDHKITLRLNESEFRREFYGGYRGDVLDVNAHDEFKYSNGGSIGFGAGFERDRVEKSAGVRLGDDTKNSRYIYAANTNSLGAVVLNEALRFDAYENFSDKLTFKIGAKWNFWGDLFVSGSVKSGFLAPNLYQQNYGLTSNLGAEESLGYEISAGNSHFSATYFDQSVKNAIEYAGFYPNDFYRNLDGKSRFKGVELEARYRIKSLLGELSYTYLDAKDANGDLISRRPKELFSGSLTWILPPHLSLNFKGSYIGERYDTLGGAQTGRYFVADMSANYDINSHFALYLDAKNIFDRYYQSVDGYGSYGRSFYFGARGGF